MSAIKAEPTRVILWKSSSSSDAVTANLFRSLFIQAFKHEGSVELVRDGYSVRFYGSFCYESATAMQTHVSEEVLTVQPQVIVFRNMKGFPFETLTMEQVTR